MFRVLRKVKLLIILALLGGIAYGLYSNTITKSEEASMGNESDAVRELETISARIKAQKEASKSRAELQVAVTSCEEFLGRYKSPMAKDCLELIRIADEFGLHRGLIPAISVVESTGCNAIPVGSFNCWGWNRGRARFASFVDGARTVAQGLSRNYDHADVRTTAYKYCPPSDCDTERWIKNVTNLMETQKRYIAANPI